jgi:hypothetical protein
MKPTSKYQIVVELYCSIEGADEQLARTIAGKIGDAAVKAAKLAKADGIMYNVKSKPSMIPQE